jgi:hypothetical protein
MKNKLILILALTAALNVSAKCIPAVEEQYAVLDMAVITGNVKLRNSLTEKYCFNSPQFYKEVSKPQHKLFQGVFKSRSVEDLKIYFPEGSSISVFGEGNYARDLLSFAVSAYHSPRMNEKEVRLADKYLAPGEKINVTPEKLTTKEHDELMSYIVKAYNKEGYTFTNTSDRNNMFHYVIVANNPKVLNELTDNNSYRNLYLYKKSLSGLTPLHFAFAKKMPYDEATQKTDTPLMNNLLLNFVTKERVQLLTYLGTGGPALSYFEFAEIMKDENPDFYKKLQAKFNFKVNMSEERQKALKPILTKALVLQNVIESYKDLPE